MVFMVVSLRFLPFSPQISRKVLNKIRGFPENLSMAIAAIYMAYGCHRDYIWPPRHWNPDRLELHPGP